MGEVDGIQDLQGQEGIKIRAAKGTVQYKSDAVDVQHCRIRTSYHHPLPRTEAKIHYKTKTCTVLTDIFLQQHTHNTAIHMRTAS